jgi:hypothetical protein
VIEASRAVAQRDLQAVADLDPQLAASGPADPWFAEAVKLRIDWRSSVSNPELTKQFSEQAWRILDLAMANRSDHEFLAMRVFAASRAGRQNEVIQSARGYIKTVDFQLTGVEEGYIAPGAQELALKSRQLNTIIELTAEARRVASDSTRNDLQSGFDNLSQRLQVLSREQVEKQ